MISKFSVANFQVGVGESPFIIAEVGINHNGEISKALEMIRVAKEAGADCVKFQTFRADEFVGDRAQNFTYQSQGRPVTESMYEMFKRYELKREDWFRIKEECAARQIMFLSTPQNRSDLNLLLEVGVQAVKVGSDDFTNLPLLKDYASSGLPLFVSCGMSDMAEVYQALQTIGTLQNYPTVLLLCTSQYPTPPEDVNLLKLRTLSGAFPGLPLGFSDHTQGPLASSLAVSMGACVFEKHFTLDRSLPGPDHWFSENPASLNEWVTGIRTAHKMMGDALVRPTKKEEQMRTLARRSVVALQEIGEGESFTPSNVGLRRPGSGLAPLHLPQVLGATSLRPFKKGDLIMLGDFKR